MPSVTDTPKKEIVAAASLPAVSEESPLIDKLMVAVSNGMQVEVLEKFMDLAERQQKREAEQAYHKAFADFKADPPKIVKDALVDYKKRDGTRTKYEHATIGNVVDSIIQGMSKHGLSHSWQLNQEGSTIAVTCKITHSLGHSEETTLKAGADTSGGKNSIQAIASTVTYLERYTLQAATGIAVLDKDDDGQAHQDPVEQPHEKQAKSKAPVEKQKKGKEDRKAIEQWLGEVSKYKERTLDQFTAWKEQNNNNLNQLTEWFNNNNPDQGHELSFALKEMEDWLMEKETSK